MKKTGKNFFLKLDFKGKWVNEQDPKTHNRSQFDRSF